MHPIFSFQPRPGRAGAWYFAGAVLAGLAVVGLFLQHAYLWVLCPQSLAVMYYRQSMGSPDSLGAAGYPDLAVVLLYFPLVGWLLARAQGTGRLQQTALWIGIAHLAAVGIAIVAAKFRNEVWAYQLGS